MKVLLIQPKIDYSTNYIRHWLPYSLLSLASQLEFNDIKTAIIDENEKVIKITNDILEDILLVGITSMTGTQLRRAVEIINEIKRISPNLPIVMGGAFPTLYPEEASNIIGLDYLIISQGELAIVALAKALLCKQSFDDIPNFIDCKTKKKTPIKLVHRSELALFNYSLIDTKRYIQNDEFINTRTINYISSQGCPYGCTFCSDTNLYQRKWLYQNVEQIIQSVNTLIDNYNINGLKFYDSNFFVLKDRVLSFSDYLINKDCGLLWAAAAHPKDLLRLSEEEVKTIAKSGCRRLLVGLESSSDSILNLVEKGVTQDQLLYIINLLEKYGIHGSYTLIVGFPGETTKESLETIEFGKRIVDKIHNCEVKIHIFYPFKGAKLYDVAVTSNFKVPITWEEISQIDYYLAQTPFVNENISHKVRVFNEQYSNSVKSSK